MWIDVLVLFALGAGTFFMLVASVGIVHLDDFYQRIHAPTKAATLGLFFLFTATAFVFGDRGVYTKAILAMVLLAVTAPTGAHLLTRAAYRHGVKPSKPSIIDEYEGTVQERKQRGEPEGPKDL